jgi:hypothetical protein
MSSPRRQISVLATIPLVLGACSASTSPTATNSPTPLPAIASVASAAPSTALASPTATPIPGADAAGIVWLCMPGTADDPCAGDLSVTSIEPSGERTTSQPTPAANPPIDCFYVYPTTSHQTTMNANLSIDPEERGVAAAQAALFSQVCKVYAPIYPQLTIPALNSGQITLANVQTAYDGVKAAFDDYLASYNHGRGIVFIGHSQGAMLLADLLHFEVDPNPEVVKLVVSALLMGGNVTVPAEQGAIGDFVNIPACDSASQTGCVVGYSSFDETPPVVAVFGRVSGALGMVPIPTHGAQKILCVNPAAPGRAGALLPHFPTADVVKLADGPSPAPTTAFVSYPNALTAECRSDGDATWLQITRLPAAQSLPTLAGSEGPSWGLHDLDVSLALGNLVELVRAEAAAFGS